MSANVPCRVAENTICVMVDMLGYGWWSPPCWTRISQHLHYVVEEVFFCYCVLRHFHNKLVVITPLWEFLGLGGERVVFSTHLMSVMSCDFFFSLQVLFQFPSARCRGTTRGGDRRWSTRPCCRPPSWRHQSCLPPPPPLRTGRSPPSARPAAASRTGPAPRTR